MVGSSGQRRLLVVHHSPTAATVDLLNSVLVGANQPEIEGVDVTVMTALEAEVDDVLAADGYLIGTPTNFGYMSGALKHFFDVTYEAVIDQTRGRPWGLWVHGRNDASGAVASVERIVTGLAWRSVSPPVVSLGAVDDEARNACWELGAVVAATVAC